MRIEKLLLLFIVVFSLYACTKDVAPIATIPECEDTISYSVQVQPIIAINCSTSNCHDAATAVAGLSFTNYSEISTNADTILSAMNHEPGIVPMPWLGTQLPDSIRQQFSCWINQGKLNN